MNWSLAAEVVKAVAAVVATVGGVVALRQFWRGNRMRRAEWLASLHEQFFEKDRYSRARRALDYEADPNYPVLRAAITDNQPHEIADELYRYLNFFEFLAGLRRLRQISDPEIRILFDYDLTMIRRHEFIVAALRPQGFEYLHELLKTFPSARSTP
jgi:hypothetical protein